MKDNNKEFQKELQAFLEFLGFLGDKEEKSVEPVEKEDPDPEIEKREERRRYCYI